MVFLRFSFVVILAVTAIAGCGSDTSEDASMERINSMAGGTLKPVVPVSGKVLIDGVPAGGVTIYLHAAANPKSIKEIKTDDAGVYAWSTYVADDGLEPGSYVLTFRQLARQRKNDSFDPKDDKLNSKFSNPAKSQFKLEVVAAAPQVNVDYDLKTK